MRESCKIINQVLNKIKVGSIKVEDFSISSFKNQIVNSMENLITHYKLYSKGVLLDQKEEYTSVEAPKGEFGLYNSSLNDSTLYRCKIKSPGYFHLQSLNFMVKNHLIADLVTIIGTQDIVFGEIDR